MTLADFGRLQSIVEEQESTGKRSWIIYSDGWEYWYTAWRGICQERKK